MFIFPLFISPIFFFADVVIERPSSSSPSFCHQTANFCGENKKPQQNFILQKHTNACYFIKESGKNTLLPSL